MRVTLKTINDELARRGATARLAKAAGYFYFEMGGLSSATDFIMNSEHLHDALARLGPLTGTHELLLEAEMLDGSSPAAKLISVR